MPKASKTTDSPQAALEELLEHATFIRRKERNPETAIAIAQIEKSIHDQINEMAKAA